MIFMQQNVCQLRRTRLVVAVYLVYSNEAKIATIPEYQRLEALRDAEGVSGRFGFSLDTSKTGDSGATVRLGGTVTISVGSGTTALVAHSVNTGGRRSDHSRCDVIH